MRIRNVRFHDFMNLLFYKEDGRIHLEVSSPNHAPASYYAEPVEAH